jgi:hypothetical protein
LTQISANPDPREADGRPANDNQPGSFASFSVLDLIDDEGNVADIARRAERLGNAVLIAMATCLIAAPALWVAISYVI